MIHFVVRFLIGIFRVWLILDFMNHFFEKKKWTERYFRCTIIIAGFVYSAFCLTGKDILELFALPLILTISTRLHFVGKYFIQAAYILTGILILHVCDFLFVSRCNFIEFERPYIFAQFLSLIAAFFLISMLGKVSGRKDKELPARYVLALFALSLCSDLILEYMLNRSPGIPGVPDFAFYTVGILLLVGNLTNFYYLEKINLSIAMAKEEEHKNIVYRHKENHYCQLEKINRENSMFFHDVSKNMRIIGRLAECSDFKEIQSILDSMRVRMDEEEKQN